MIKVEIKKSKLLFKYFLLILNLFEFLSKHKAKDDKTGSVVTHTRIPDE